ncbi:MAG TPA: glycosyltransferase family 39 protein [Candidatus Limiplasma sp.]|nr:glycosyltransferase family 39 protein [Candidatus Limiplasma sp.]
MALLSNRKSLYTVLCCVFTAILLAVFGYLCFGNLGVWHIEDYDEAIFGVNAYEMIHNDDYLIHTYQGEIDLYNTKPPLSFWMITLAYKIFGYNAFALRFFSALASLLGGIAIALWAMKHYGKWAVPFILLIFTANSILYGLHFLRYGDADSQYELFFTLSMLCLLQSHKKFPWLYGCGFFFSLAFMEKSIHALVIPVVCFITLVFTGRLKELTWKRVFLLLASALSIILIWVIARIARNGTAFFTHAFQEDVVGRVGGGIAEPEYADMPSLIYNVLAVFGQPTTFLCLLLSIGSAAILIVKKIRLTPFSQHAVIATLAWLVVPIALYSIADVKFRWYVYSGLMAMPVLTCILAFAVIRSGALHKTVLISVSIFTAALIAMSVIDVVYVATIKFDHTVQAFIQESLDRDLNSGEHAYILYAENEYTNWMPADILTAQYYGDLICINGGLDAFEADDEPCLLFIARTNNEELIEELMGQEIIFYENYYCVAFEKY